MMMINRVYSSMQAVLMASRLPTRIPPVQRFLSFPLECVLQPIDPVFV